MLVYKVRTLDNNKNWNTIRVYASYAEAHTFASQLWTEWDIKEATLDDANAEEAK
jgi:hypothetical protein